MLKRRGIIPVVAVAFGVTVIAVANRSSATPSPSSPPATPPPARTAPSAPGRVSAALPAGEGASPAVPGFDPRGEWPLAAMDAPALWTISEGSGVLVGVVDTGVDTGQPDLAGAVVKVIGSHGDQSSDSHGTAIAGLIAGRGSTSDPDGHVAGLAPRAVLIDVRVTTQAAKATPGAIAAGIVEAAEAGARVINVSLTVPHDDQRLDIAHAVRLAQARGCLVVASAGPSGSVTYPGALPDVLVAAGITQGGQPIASLAGYASAVYAPGADLVSTAEERAAGGGHGGYITGISGDDYAAAYVSGTAALLFSADPRLSADQVRALIAPRNLAAPGRLNPLAILSAIGLHPYPAASPSGPSSPASPLQEASAARTARHPVPRGNAAGSPGAAPGPRPSSALLLWAIAILVLVVVAALIGAWLRFRDGKGPRPPGRPTPSAPHDPDLTSSGWDSSW